MLTKVKIGVRLVLLTVITVFALVMIGAIGLVTTSSVYSALVDTRNKAQIPVKQFAEINERLREGFQQLYAASLHHPDLQAAAYHDHPVSLHLDAASVAMATLQEDLAAYGRTEAGTMFPAKLAAFQDALRVYVREGFQEAVRLAAADNREGYARLGVFLTTTTLPQFSAAKDAAAALLSAHTDVAHDMVKRGERIYDTAILAVVVGGVMASVIAVAGAIAIGASITRPVRAMCVAMERLADRDYTTEVPGREQKDEIGDMAKAVEVFKLSMIKADELSTAQWEEARKRDERGKRIEALNNAFDHGVGSVLSAVTAAATQLDSTAARMASIAEQTNTQATTVAAASEQASSNVQTVASAAEQLSSSISEIGRQVQQSADIARQAASEADRTNHVVSGLAEAAGRIGDVINLITDIASQTNLLALNATIEAARAGDAGKGFAVVANEVKALAGQTAKATEDIGRQISTVQAETQTAVAAIEGIAQVINRINDVTGTIAAAVEEQDAATQEIARNVQQASQGTAEVSTTIVDVTGAARDAGEAADSVLQATGSLTEQSHKLKEMVEGFLADVRAA